MRTLTTGYQHRTPLSYAERWQRDTSLVILTKSVKMTGMIVILQVDDLSVDMAIATSLIEIGVIGAPLILAVCQFINSRNESRTDAQTVIETVLLGSLSMISVFLMWGLFFIGSLWIWQATGYSPTSDILLSFACMYFLFILLIMGYQFYYMVADRLQITVISFILGVFFVTMTIIAYIQGNLSQGDIYFYSFCAILLFVMGIVLYPPINSILSDHIPYLRKIDEDDNQNDKEDNSDFEKEWWRVWNEENENN